MASPLAARRSTRARARSFDSGKPLFPDVVELHRRDDITQAVFGDFTMAAFFHQSLHVHAGDTVRLRRVDAECLAVEIQVELARRAVASAHAVKGELLGEIAVRFRGVTITKPILARDGHEI